MRGARVLLPALLLLAVGILAGCAEGDTTDLAPPRAGECRQLPASAADASHDDTPTVPCTRRHTAETFLVGTLPTATGSAYDDRRHGRHVYRTCRPAFASFLGADESLAMRIQLSWAWFRPSPRAWEGGARWFRCDVLGGPDGAARLRSLPRTTEAQFADRRPDAWLSCARGEAFPRAVSVPCSEPHDWRAVATVKLGAPADPYPGDRVSEVRARDYCSDQVGAWLDYAPDYRYAYTWFHEAEWRAGNRRAVCWAGTTR